MRASEGAELRYEPEGEPERLELLPPVPESEIEGLADRIPCPLPESVRELLEHTRGFATGPLESLEFGGLGTFEVPEVFPHPVDLAHDGFGNYWVVDLSSGSREWGPEREFSWGRYGPRTENRRVGEAPVFAYQRRSRGQRFKDWLGWGWS